MKLLTIKHDSTVISEGFEYLTINYKFKFYVMIVKEIIHGWFVNQKC